MRSLDDILNESSARHRHLCPRQVLGARMGLYASELLDIDLPRNDKRMLVIAETDGCTVDGIIAATNCRAGSRTLRVLDFGKVAATFIDVHTETSFRIVPRREVRSSAHMYSPDAKSKWEAMLKGYQVMPVSELLFAQQVQLNTSLAEMISRPGAKVVCESCDEEIINGREEIRFGETLCRSCAGEAYYRLRLSHQELIVKS